MSEVPSIDRLWGVKEVFAYLGVPVKTLYQWKWRGEGPPFEKLVDTSDTSRQQSSGGRRKQPR